MPDEMASSLPAGIHILPYDILFSIFSFLPIPDMARCAAVCKQWHEIVTGFTHLWKGKRYLSDRSPNKSAETRAIWHALPLFQEVFVDMADKFAVDILYPRLVLLVADTSNIGAVIDYPSLRCVYLSTRLDIAECIFSTPSTIDFVALQKLQIAKAIPILDEPEEAAQHGSWEECRLASPVSVAEYTVGSALKLCPNLRELSVYAEFLSADYLLGLENIGQLRTLEIECPGLEELVFLQHCSNVLEELELRGCADLPSAAYARLRCLSKLQRLRMRDCCAVESDLETAAMGLVSLRSLQLDCCDLVSDLSFLRHCSQLRELRVKASPLDVPLMGLHRLPASIRSLCLVSNAVTADELSEALPHLPLLEELDLSSSELSHLRFLHSCPRLRRLCLEFSCWSDASDLSNLRHLTRLEVLDLTRCRINADILSGTMPSMPGLVTLSLSHAENVAHLRFLRHCPQLRSLSLFYTFGMELKAYHELCHLTNLQHLSLSEDVCDLVCETIRLSLPQITLQELFVMPSVMTTGGEILWTDKKTENIIKSLCTDWNKESALSHVAVTADKDS